MLCYDITLSYYDIINSKNKLPITKHHMNNAVSTGIIPIELHLRIRILSLVN